MRLRGGGRAKGEKQAGRGARTARPGEQAPADLDTGGALAIGCVLGLNSRPATPGRPPINEWGLYDPETCGYGALLASLGTAANKEAEPIDEDPADLLLRQQTRPLGLPTEVLQSDAAGDGGQPTHLSPAASAVAECHVGHFAPLALWARLNDSEPAAPALAEHGAVSRAVAEWSRRNGHRDGQHGSDDLTALLGGRVFPAQIVSTQYAPGCMIRQVRIAPAPDLPDVELLPPDVADVIDDMPTTGFGAIDSADTLLGDDRDERLQVDAILVDSAPPAAEIDLCCAERAAEDAAPQEAEPVIAEPPPEAEPEIPPGVHDVRIDVILCPPPVRRRVRVAMALG